MNTLNSNETDRAEQNAPGGQTPSKKKNTPLSLFLHFFKIGCFTFGGGWSIVAQIQKDYIDERHDITSQELLDIVGVGRSIPGTMIGNVAYLFGYNQAGVLGGIGATLGICLPPLIILSVVTMFYTAFRDNLYVARAFKGVRACVAPVIFSALLRLWNGAFPKKICYVLFAGACIASAWFGVSSVILIVIGILSGLLIGRITGRKDKEKEVC